ncbi:MAG: putative PEP-binding protein [Candidatus Dormibacterales bacterium]
MARGPESRRLLRGSPASPGRAAGPIHIVLESREAEAVPAGEASLGALRSAADRAAAKLEELAATRRAAGAGGAAAEVLESHAMILRDPALEESMAGQLARGLGAREAVLAAVELHAAPLEALDEPYLRERAADVREAGRLLLAALGGRPTSRLAELRRPSVVVARELSPADTLSVDAGLVLAVVTEAGGVSSHAAIVARELGIPAVVGAAGAVLAASGRKAALVDGGRGEVTLLDRAPRARSRPAAARLDLGGLPVRLMANVGSPAATAAAARIGALGVGLYRTELLFLGRSSPMPEKEQAEAYAAACSAMAPHPVVVRTLDAGSDKPLGYLASRREPNPALGRRGVRLWLGRRELWEPQVRALIRAWSEHPNLRVMLPMVAAPEEMRAARSLFEAEAARRKVAVPPLGMMLETPAAAAAVQAFRGLADFASLGTNDLAQYALGADRELEWEPYLDEFSPGVLRLLSMAARSALAAGIELGACGEMAGRPEGALFLAGVGVASLSMAPGSLVRVHAALARAGEEGCRRAAAQALEAGEAATARAALAAALS